MAQCVKTLAEQADHLSSIFRSLSERTPTPETCFLNFIWRLACTNVCSHSYTTAYIHRVIINENKKI